MIDAMTLFEVAELTAYWAEHPPTHILCAAFLGAGATARRRRSSGETGLAGEAAVLAGLGPGFHRGDVHQGLARPVLGFAELQRRHAGAR